MIFDASPRLSAHRIGVLWFRGPLAPRLRPAANKIVALRSIKVWLHEQGTTFDGVPSETEAKICEECGNVFALGYGGKRFCTEGCYNRSRRRLKQERLALRREKKRLKPPPKSKKLAVCKNCGRVIEHDRRNHLIQDHEISPSELPHNWRTQHFKAQESGEMKHPLLLEEFITSYMDVIETLPPKKEYCDMCNRSVEAFLWCDLYLCADCYDEVTEACLKKAVEDLRETLPPDQYDAIMRRIEKLERELRWIIAVSNSIRERIGLPREHYEALHQYSWKWGRGRTYVA